MEEPIAPAENAAPAATVAEDSSPVESPTTEPTTSQETAPAEGPQAEEQTTVESERQPRPAQRRIQELVQQNKQLKEQLATAPVPAPPPQAPRLSDLLQGKDQVMPDELDQVGKQVFQQGAQAGEGRVALELHQLRQEMVVRDAINETEKEAAVIPNQFHELNENDPAYNPILEKKIADRYVREAVRPDPTNPNRKVIDPTVKLADLAREEVEFFRAATEAGKAQVSNTLAQQADEAALTPTGTTPEPDKSFDDLSLNEMEARLRAQGRDI